VEDEKNRPLFERIRERCREEAQHSERSSTYAQVAAHLCRDTEIPDGLPWPPATEAQLDATEAQLHFPLPPRLRALYAEVGNGGFWGITGAVGGAPHAGDWYKNIVGGYSAHKHFIDLSAISAARMHGERFELPLGTWPKYLLPFCYWGCNTEHAISAQTGEVFVVIDGCCFANWVPSLDDWLEAQLDGTLEQE
jgi:hypothetical protein